MTNMADFEKTICPHSEFCGGCKYQGIPYAEQLVKKEDYVTRLLEKAGVDPVKRDPIEGCDRIYEYRNKMEYTFGDMVKGGEMTLGMHLAGKYWSIVTTDQCQLVHPDFNKILKATLMFCAEKGYPRYGKKFHDGLMRNLVVRRGVRTGELLVNVVTASDEASGHVFDQDGFRDMILRLDLENQVVGIMRTVTDKAADAVIADDARLLYGRNYYMEELMGLKFKVGAFSFFQTNIDAVERLYTEAVGLISDLEGKEVFDLYSGTGTISQVMALRAKHVTGIELVGEAVEAARNNAGLNGLSNCDFFEGDVFKVLDEQVDSLPDVIVCDPPRPGIGYKALEKICSYGVNEIVYVSCNPKTLVNDLVFFEARGYRVMYLKAFDNFPFTSHVECVSLLQRMSNTRARSITLDVDMEDYHRIVNGIDHKK